MRVIIIISYDSKLWLKAADEFISSKEVWILKFEIEDEEKRSRSLKFENKR